MDSARIDSGTQREVGHRRVRADMTRQIRICVAGMSCRRCVREVTALLRDVPGVETVVADISSSSVRLSGTMTVLDVRAAFGGLTYRPRILELPQSAAEA